MERNPDKEYEELMKAFEGRAEEAQNTVNAIADKIREERERQQQKELPPTIIEGEVEE